jgi:hypothetical protein
MNVKCDGLCFLEHITMTDEHGNPINQKGITEMDIHLRAGEKVTMEVFYVGATIDIQNIENENIKLVDDRKPSDINK